MSLVAGLFTLSSESTGIPHIACPVWPISCPQLASGYWCLQLDQTPHCLQSYKVFCVCVLYFCFCVIFMHCHCQYISCLQYIIVNISHAKIIHVNKLITYRIHPPLVHMFIQYLIFNFLHYLYCFFFLLTVNTRTFDFFTFLWRSPSVFFADTTVNHFAALFFILYS